MVVPRIIEEKSIILAGMDFYGYPYETAGGWSEDNAIGQLWERFTRFCSTHEGAIQHQVSEAGYELWLDVKQNEEDRSEYIFVGVEIDCVDDLPLELVVKVLPRTRYGVFALKGAQITGDWPNAIEHKWLPEAGLHQSHDFIIERYDPVRFKGLEDPDSELDIYVPII